MVSKKKKRNVSRLEEIQDSLETSFPKWELCSYDYFAYLVEPKLNKLTRPSTPFEKVLKRQKKFLFEITKTLRYLSMNNRPESYVSKFLASSEFNDFQDLLVKIYLDPKMHKTKEAITLYSNLIIMGTNGLKHIMPKSFGTVLDRDLIPLQKLVRALSEYSKQLGKKGNMARMGVRELDFTVYEGL